MNEEALGANHWLSRPATLHTVRPLSSALSSGHFRIAPPHSSRERPRCFWYQAARALGSFTLKKTPPMPVMRAMQAPWKPVICAATIGEAKKDVEPKENGPAFAAPRRLGDPGT